MNILFCGYRQWAEEIFSNIGKYNWVGSPTMLEDRIKLINPDLIFFIGWSWIVPKEIIEKYKCICLHPSPLPKYRGGSPLQNQIINGEKESAITLFLMNDEIDAGNILKQEKFSLEGELSDIFKRIAEIGTRRIKEIIRDFEKGSPIFLEQDESEATICKRRKPEESEITEDELKTKPAEYLFNKIRMLQDPYPNAYIKCSGGKKLFLTTARIKNGG